MSSTRSLVFCTTCKFSQEEKFAPDGRSGGEVLIEKVRELLAERGREDIRIARQTCLWSCTRHCNVWFRDGERFSYLAGDFTPTRETYLHRIGRAGRFGRKGVAINFVNAHELAKLRDLAAYFGVQIAPLPKQLDV